MSLFHPTDARWLRARTTAPSSFGISPRSKRPPHSTDIERRFQPSPFRPTANIWPAAAGRCASGTRQHSKKLPRQARQSGRGDEYAEWCGNHEGRARLSQCAVRGRCAGTDAPYDTKSIGMIEKVGRALRIQAVLLG